MEGSLEEEDKAGRFRCHRAQAHAAWGKEHELRSHLGVELTALDVG